MVSATRIEPPLHPDGPEKILLDCGIEPEEFDEDKLLTWLNTTDTGVLNQPKVYLLMGYIQKRLSSNKWTRPTIRTTIKRG